MVDFIIANSAGSVLVRLRTDAPKLSQKDKFTIMSIDFISTDVEKALFEVAYKLGHEYTLANLKAFILSKSLNMVAQVGNDIEAVTNQALATPVISAVNGADATTLKVNFGNITGNNGYTLQRATNVGFTTGVVGFEIGGGGQVLTNYTVTGLTTGTTYYIRLKAKGSLNLFGCADSAYSANGTGTTS